MVPAVEMTWGGWSALHPHTRVVLVRDGAHARLRGLPLRAVPRRGTTRTSASRSRTPLTSGASQRSSCWVCPATREGSPTRSGSWRRPVPWPRSDTTRMRACTVPRSLLGRGEPGGRALRPNVGWHEDELRGTGWSDHRRGDRQRVAGGRSGCSGPARRTATDAVRGCVRRVLVRMGRLRTVHGPLDGALSRRPDRATASYRRARARSPTSVVEKGGRAMGILRVSRRWAGVCVALSGG